MKTIGKPITIFIALCAMACASGSAIVTGTQRAPVEPAVVKLYLESPSKAYDVIGLVKASSDSGLTDQGSIDYAIVELKSQAAKLGANGVVLTNSGQHVSGFVTGEFYTAPVHAHSVSGTAIYIPSNSE